MWLALALFFYAGLLGWGVNSVLARSTWPQRAPRMALRVWHATAFGVLGALSWALLALAHDVMEHALSFALQADKARLHTVYAEPREVSAYWNATFALLLTGAFTMTIIMTRRLLAARRLAREHDLAVVGTMTVEAVDGICAHVALLHSPVPAIYCLGRNAKQQRIHVTYGAVQLLSGAELRAAIEHEQAHIQHRHHTMMLVAGAITSALRWTRLLQHYDDSVNALIEMDADDYAARRHGAHVVAQALLRMSAHGVPMSGPATASWTGGSPAARIHRLLRHHEARSSELGLAAAASVVVLLPALPFASSVVPALHLVGTADSAVVISHHNHPEDGFVHHR